MNSIRKHGSGIGIPSFDDDIDADFTEVSSSEVSHPERPVPGETTIKSAGVSGVDSERKVGAQDSPRDDSTDNIDNGMPSSSNPTKNNETEEAPSAKPETEQNNNIGCQSPAGQGESDETTNISGRVDHIDDAGLVITTPKDDVDEKPAGIDEEPFNAPHISPTRKGGGGFGQPLFGAGDNMDGTLEVAGPRKGGKHPYQSELDNHLKKGIDNEFKSPSLLIGIRKIYLWGQVFIAAFLGFYTITQTTNFIVQLKDSPVFVKYPLYVAIGIFAFILSYFIYKIIRSWFAMRKNPQISADLLSALSTRHALQNNYYSMANEACNELYKILNSIKEDEYKESLKSMRFREDEIKELLESRKILCKLHKDRMAGMAHEASPEWIKRFAVIYQEKLDSFAKERIKHYSIRGAVGATISRIPTMDRFIVLYSMFALVIDLLKIYNIRPSKLNATILLSKVVINTFLAGYSQAGAEALAEGACWIGASLTSIDPIVGKILGLGIKFSAEATAHGILIYRVGITAQKMLSPIAKK